MNNWMKWLILAGATLFLIVLALLVLILQFDLDECENRIQQTYLSPDAAYKAVVFERQCGAADKVSTQIAMLTGLESLENRAGNIYIVAGNIAKNAPTVHWESNDRLTVYQKLTGTEFKAETEWLGDKLIKIQYINR